MNILIHLLMAVEAIVCLMLIGIILIQKSKGQGLGVSFGGGAAESVFGGQMVAMYDQTSNGNSRRSLIPVKLNGEYTYLVVVFPAGSTEGRVAGANAGYDENGLPIRNMTRLNPGDQIIPIYDVYYDNGGDDLEDEEYEGEPITWQDGMTVTYEDLSDEDDPTVMLFAFVFYDIFGNDTMSELIEFEI